MNLWHEPSDEDLRDYLVRCGWFLTVANGRTGIIRTFTDPTGQKWTDRAALAEARKAWEAGQGREKDASGS